MNAGSYPQQQMTSFGNVYSNTYQSSPVTPSAFQSPTQGQSYPYVYQSSPPMSPIQPNMNQTPSSPFIGHHQTQSTRLETIFSLSPISTRCKSLDEYFRVENRCETREGLRELHNYFPYLISHLFGVSIPAKWLSNGMKNTGDPPKGGWLSVASNSFADAEAVVQLVSPNSSLFNIILKYSVSHDDSYQFPSSYLPFRIQLLANQNQDMNVLLRILPNIFRTKMNVHQAANPYANLSPGSMSEPRSIQLNLNMFEYFMMFFAYYAVVNDVDPQRNTGYGTTHPYVSILKNFLDYFLPISLSQYLPSNVSTVKIQEYKSIQHQMDVQQFFMDSLMEFWFHQNDYQIVKRDQQRQVAKNPGRTRNTHLSVVPSKLCLESQTLLLKRLLTAAVTLSTAVSPGPQHNDRLANSYNFSRATLEINQKLFFDYFSACFLLWPFLRTTTPFGLVVDLWLCYIQPWQVAHSSFSTGSISSQWMTYVEHNFPFYTVLFGDFLNASLSFSFSEDDIAMLERVVRAFSGLNLTDPNCWIRDVEKKILSNLEQAQDQSPYRPTHQAERFLSPAPSGRHVIPQSPGSTNLLQSVAGSITKLIGSVESYKPLCSTETQIVIKNLAHRMMLLQQLSQTQQRSNLSQQTYYGTPDSFLWRAQDFFSKLFEPEVKSIKLTVIDDLRKMFQIPSEEIAPSRAGAEHQTNEAIVGLAVGQSGSLLTKHFEPEIDKQTHVLTNRGKEQIKLGLRQCDKTNIPVKGDPMKLRPRTDEVVFLVHLLVKLSENINKSEWATTRNLKVNLRFLASFSSLFCILVLVVLLYLLM